MNVRSRAVLCSVAVMLVAAGCAWGRVPVRDDIGACLTQPDGSRITLPCEQVVWRGRSGKSYAIKEWTEGGLSRQHSRLVVVSTRRLPVREYWSCDLSGVLSTLPSVGKDGSALTQRVLVVSPGGVMVYCDATGRPLPFLPIKAAGINWPHKRPLSDLSRENTIGTASMSTMDVGRLPEMPDAPDDSTSPPTYCQTIAEARNHYSPSSRNLVELQCRPFDGATTTQFTLGQDDPADSITVYYTQSASLGTARINRIVGTIQKGVGINYWIEVDSGPNWQTGDIAGMVQPASEGSIQWVKTIPDGDILSDYQQNTSAAPLVEKIVSRVFPEQGFFYIQEPNRTHGIRVVDGASASALDPGDIVTIYDGDVTTVNDERVINSYYTEYVSSGPPPGALGLTNKRLGGGNYNTYTPGTSGQFGLNNIGLLMRYPGKDNQLRTNFPLSRRRVQCHRRHSHRRCSHPDPERLAFGHSITWRLRSGYRDFRAGQLRCRTWTGADCLRR